MNSFSFNRFGKTLRWVMAVNFRTLLMWTIGSVVAVFVGERADDGGDWEIFCLADGLLLRNDGICTLYTGVTYHGQYHRVECE